jgi:hypothetical protein
MKTIGTQAVKNGTEDSHEDEADHALSRFLNQPPFEGAIEPGLYLDLITVCQELFNAKQQNSHASAEELVAEVIQRFGERLHHYHDRDQLHAIATNVLIRAKREIKDETHRGEM